jgi:hypothetical protein
MTPRRERQLGLSAVVFLMLGIWLGPRLAVSLLTVAAIIATWWAMCRRWPILGVMTLGFLRGLFGR